MSARITEAMRDAAANILAQADGCQYVFAKHFDLAEMVLAAALSTEPREAVLVPKEPTEAMLLAAFREAERQLTENFPNTHCKSNEERSAHSIRPIYCAMLAAAPLPEDTNHGR